jgi:hypothetical protein
MAGEREVDMLNNMKSSAPEKDKSSAEVMGKAVQPHDQASARSEPTTKPGTGSIFHRSLSIDENSLLEESSRRLENPTDSSSSVDAKGPQKKDIQNPTPAPLPSIDPDLQRVDRWLAQSYSQMTS